MKETADLKKWIIWGTIPFILLFIFFLAIFIYPIGPGLPQHQDFSTGIIWNVGHRCNSPDRANTPGPDLCISQRNSGNYPQFPSLTQTAGYATASYAVFRKPGTNQTRVFAIWYFENSGECGNSEGQLSRYLKTQGQLTPVSLDLSSEIQSWNYAGRQAPPSTLDGTAFESNGTAGYFFVIKKAVMPSRDDCFIEYFGLIGENNLSAGSADLRQIIALEGNPWYLFTGQTGPLSEQGRE